MEPVSAFFLALFSTMVFIPLLLRVARRYNLFDKPGGRKKHVQAVPRLGGLAMAAGASLPTFIWIDMNPAFKSVLLGIGALSLTGLIDDLVSVRWQKKILVQAVAAILVVIYGQIRISSLGFWAGNEIIMPPYFSIPVTFFFILGVTNAINLSDGLDGLAAGLCTFIFGMLAVLAYIQGLTNCLVPLAAILGSIWGFLRFNTHPAVIFMGDAGSYFLGFSAAVFGIMCTQVEHSAVSPAAILLILGLPIIDTMYVMIERLASGVSVFMPDRRHIHFRLMQIGLSHKEAVMFIYAIQAAMTFVAIKMLFFPASMLAIFFLFTGIAIAGGLQLAEKTGFKFTRRWVLESSLKTIFGSKTEIFLVILPLYITAGILTVYLILIPLLFDLPLGVKGLTALSVPVMISMGFFIKKEWFQIIIRLCLYYTIALITISLLEIPHGPHAYFGMPLWYIVMLASMALCTIVYIKFAGPKIFQLTPLDLLIFLMTLGFSVTPRQILPSSPVVYPVIFSLVIFSYSMETALSQGTPRRNIVLISGIISSLIIGTKSALALLQG